MNFSESEIQFTNWFEAFKYNIFQGFIEDRKLSWDKSVPNKEGRLLVKILGSREGTVRGAIQCLDTYKSHKFEMYRNRLEPNLLETLDHDLASKFIQHLSLKTDMSRVLSMNSTYRLIFSKVAQETYDKSYLLTYTHVQRMNDILPVSNLKFVLDDEDIKLLTLDDESILKFGQEGFPIINQAFTRIYDKGWRPHWINPKNPKSFFAPPITSNNRLSEIIMKVGRI